MLLERRVNELTVIVVWILETVFRLFRELQVLTSTSYLKGLIEIKAEVFAALGEVGEYIYFND